MTQKNAAPASGSILVVGGGISGLTTAIEAAEVGYEVFVIDKAPYLGGRVSQMNQYFPKLCPPTCGLEINFRRIKDNPQVKVWTLAEVEKVEGTAGDYSVTLKILPRLVNGNCTACNKCVEVCPVERDNDFNFNMDKTKAIYRPHEMSFPMRYAIDPAVCLKEACAKCVEACPVHAVDLKMEPKNLDLKVGAIVWATGWEPYDASKIDNLGFGRYENIITNMMMERLAAPNGPTKGRIVRPSDGGEPESIAFVQCAGSRDQNHLPYCSYICCMASLKQTTYVRERYPNAKVYIFYIDLRAPGQRYEKFYRNIKEDKNVVLVKGKVAEVREDPSTKDITVVAENAVTGEKIQQTVNMVVLATGMQPTAAGKRLPADLKYTPEGFIVSETEKGGMVAAGCAARPADVVSSNQIATGAALRAIQALVRR